MNFSDAEESCILTLVAPAHVSLLSNSAHVLMYGIVKNLETWVCATTPGSGSLKIRMVMAC